MPIHMEPRENGRVIFYKLTDPWTIPELAGLYPENKVIRDKSEKKVHVIADVSESHKLPDGILKLRGVSPDIAHPTSGYLIVVGAKSFMRNLFEVAFKLLRSGRLKFVATEQEAWAQVYEIIQ